MIDVSLSVQPDQSKQGKRLVVVDDATAQIMLFTWDASEDCRRLAQLAATAPAMSAALQRIAACPKEGEPCSEAPQHMRTWGDSDAAMVLQDLVDVARAGLAGIAPRDDAATTLRTVRAEARTYDDDLDRREVAPTGDDYNALFSIVMSEAAPDPVREAAPDLLGVAKECLEAELRRREKLRPGAPASTYCEARITRIRAAIAKAEGKANG